MTGAVVICGGKPLALGPCLGRGGEGEIFAAGDGSNRAVKLYFKWDPAREAKVQALTDGGFAKTCRTVAFPLEKVFYPDRRFAGFTMRQVDGHQPIHQLLAPVSRRTCFPVADWSFLVRVAVNVARSVASVHAARVLVGDINSSNFLISQDATVTLIDADSFQVGKFRCLVGMPEYTPPELIGMNLGSVDRTANHDFFGLAVLLFQILCLGRHPFAGVLGNRNAPIETAIARGQFAYSTLRDSGASPPGAAVSLNDLPRGIREKFERAFAPRVGLRPVASDWVSELQAMESDLIICPRHPYHHIAHATAPCPWCRIEGEIKKPVFRAAPASQRPPASPPDTKLHHDVRAAIAAAKSCAAERIMPTWHRPGARPSKSAELLRIRCKFRPDEIRESLRNQWSGDGRKRFHEVIARYARADAAATRATELWRRKLGVWDIHALADQLHNRMKSLDQAISRQSIYIARGVSAIAAAHTTERLRAAKIRDAVIAGVGPALRSRLSQHSIETAADISRDALTKVSLLGTDRAFALLLWQEGLAVAAERSLRGNEQFMLHAAEQSTSQFRDNLGKLTEAIKGEITDLQRRQLALQKQTACIDPPLVAALAEREQARVDLEHLGIYPPAAVRAMVMNTVHPPPTSVPPTPVKRAAKSCPLCGSPMVKRWAPSSRSARVTTTMFFGCSRYPTCRGTLPARSAGKAP